MGEYVTRAQHGDHFFVGGGWFVDVGHQRQAGLLRHLQRDVQRGNTLVARGMAPDAHLDADDHVAVGVSHLSGGHRVHQADVLALAHHHGVGEAIDSGVAHMQVGQDPDGGALDHVLAEAHEVAGAGRARVDRGGDA